jgi:tetratricopeptide (TPR) repeat protein
LIQGCLAVPRRLLRRPGRNLAILGLLLLIGAGTCAIGAYVWASYHLRAARAALDSYHNQEAIEHLQDALTVWPRDLETLCLAARAARRAGRFDEADHLLDQYPKTSGQEDERLVLERVLVRAERGELDSVSNYCRTQLEQNPTAAPLILEAVSRACLRLYRRREAQQALDEWLKRQPDNPQALVIQGQLYDLEMRQHDAIASYRRALTVDPEMEDARLRLCDALMQLGLVEEALPHLEYLNRRFPDNLMVQVHLARVRNRKGETKEAEKIIEAVLERRPQFAPALAERGKLARGEGRTDEAEKWLRQAVALEPGDSQAHYHLFLCLEQNGKPEEARKEQARLTQIEEDIKLIQEITNGKLEADPHNVTLLYQVGTIALRAGSIEEGLRWLHRALKEDPNHVDTHKALMEYYQRIGDFGRAREHRQKAEVRSKN